MMSSADAINAVQDIQSIFTSLPASTKPRTRDNGKKEWTVLSAIFLWKCTDTTRLECVSIGTGLKALPSVSICPHGDNLHDMHAEVIARRGFLRWLLVQKNCISKEHSWLELNDQGKCKLRSEVRVGIYSSTLPCGDASMSLLTHKDEETPVPTAAAEFAKREYWGWSSEDLSSPVIRGRIGYSGPFRGKLRTKPGRLDSLPTYSMSCSDKILGWSIYGVQGKALSRWFEGPIFIDAFVFEVDDACISKEQVMESLWGRGCKWNRGDPISQYPSPSPQPAIFLLPPSFLYSRLNTKDAVACNESISWIKGEGHELLIQGVRRGNKAIKPKIGVPREKPYKGRSRISRSALLELSADIGGDKSEADDQTYLEVKRRTREVGGVLHGWIVGQL